MHRTNCVLLQPTAAARFARTFSKRDVSNDHFKLVVVGGGAGGATIVNKFTPKLGRVAVIDAAQPGWTLVGAGIKDVAWTARAQKDVLNKNATWVQQMIVEFRPQENTVVTKDGRVITYDYLVVACGIQLRFDLIKGLPAAFDTPGVCSNYSVDTVGKTWTAFQQFTTGNALFTFPNSPIKCAGAPQKICYLFDAYLRKVGAHRRRTHSTHNSQNNKRQNAEIYYNTALPVIFGIPKYAAALNAVVKDRDIHLQTRHVLKEIRASSSEAVFDVLDEQMKPTSEKVQKYSLLHVGAPCSPPECLRAGAPRDFVDAAGFVDVHKHTMQHVKYPNVFAIGDCANTPNAKTAAAVAGQCGVVRKNLQAVIDGKPVTAQYDGYASCPLVTSYDKCILAEFGYNGPLETFPFNQAHERRSMFQLKKRVMSPLYWHALLNGYWEGPRIYRKLMHGGFSE